MEKDILLTIAIPTYNNSNVLARAIESCQNQTDLTNCEIVIVNNASSDNTQNIIDQFKNSKLIKSYKLELKITQAANHNYFLKKSSGRYILFCHADDCLDIDAVKIVKQNLIKRQYPNKYIFWGHSMINDPSYELEKYGLEVGRIFAGQRAILPLLSGISPSGTCYSKDMINFGGFLESSLPLSPYDSSSMVFLALKGFRFEMVEDIIVHRVLASTHTPNQKMKTLITSYANSYDVLRNELSVNEKERLLNSAIVYNHRPPLLYLNYESNYNPKKIFIPIIIHSILRPWLLGKKLFWMTFFNIVLRTILKKN